MKLNRISVVSALVAMAVSPFALTGAASAQQNKAEVIHWWTSAGEAAAVKVFADQFAKAGGTWVDTAIAGGVNARTAAINRTVGGKPPTAMQFNTGKQFDDLVENNLLADVEAAAQAGNWRKVMPQAIVDAATRNGKFYAVPVNIHGQNWLFYNTAVLEKAGAKPPTSFDDIFDTLDKLKASGTIPLALGGQKTWERNLFNAVAAGKGGRDFFVNMWGKRDEALVRGPQFRQVAETFARLRGYVDPASPGRNWNDSVSLVIAGKAGMHFNGDWAKGEFIAAGQNPGKEYGCTVVGNAYLMGGDVFVMARTTDRDQIAAQQLLTKVLVDPETQIAFSAKKGSIPVRTDLDVGALDSCAQQATRLIADAARQAPANELLSPATVTGAVEDVISQFWNTPGMSIDDFVNRFVRALKTDA